MRSASCLKPIKRVMYRNTLVQPEEHKPENVEPEPAEDTGSSSPEPEVSVGAYRYALQMRPAAPWRNT